MILWTVGRVLSVLCNPGRMASVIAAVGLCACGGGSDSPSGEQGQSSDETILTVNAVTSRPIVVNTVTVQNLTLKAERRISRTAFEYDYQLTVRNNSVALASVTVQLVGVGAGSTIVDGKSEVAQLAADATVVLTDLITLRHDRLLPFDRAALTWQVTVIESVPSVPGILLPGAPDDPAVAAIPQIDVARSAADLATAVDAAADTRYHLKQLQAVISATATVGQVNTALQGVGGRIVWAMERNRVVTIQVPNEGDLDALQALAATLEASPAFDSVSLYVVPATAALPPNVTAADAAIATGPILNQMAGRMHAVWNANGADISQSKVKVVIADYFGNGAMTEVSGPVSGILEPSSAYAARTHGYHVLGILAANFGGPAGGTGPVTGALSRSLPITVVDLVNVQGVAWEAVRMRLGGVIANSASDARLVVNLSLQYCQVPNPSTGLCVPGNQPKKDAEAWRQWTRSIYLSATKKYYDWEHQVLVVAAAGNHTGKPAETASPINAAALLPTIISKGDNTPVPPLNNVIVVEARKASASANGPAAGCRDGSYSNKGGTVAGIGTDVFSFLSPNSTGRLEGTSMATPQVTGVAALLSAIRPNFTPSDIKYRIEHVRFKTDEQNCPGDAPMVDAYAALLSLDTTMFDAPVRTALMRLGDNSAVVGETFGLNEARQFLMAYFPAVYGLTPAVQPDFSRYDLNGDGYTGDVARKAPFDLKFVAVNAPFTSEDLDSYSNSLPTALNEAAVTDFEVLCYYVNSPLFNDAERSALDRELADVISVHASVNRKVSCADPVVRLYLNTPNAGWDGIPAVMELSDLVSRFPATLAGNSATCTNQGVLPGERGIPLFSGSVPAPIPLMAALVVTNVPRPLNGGVVNRRNCSSFVAISGQQVWINATGRAVFGFGGAVVSDWEYQVRYTNGDATGNGKSCRVGVVPGFGFFSASFNDPTCRHELSSVIKE